MLRWTELAISSRISSSKTKFILVLHTEGLVNAKIARTLAEFGKDLGGAYRPLLTVVTPLCPQYHVDPLKDPQRLSFPVTQVARSAEADFASRLNELSSLYDIGYHGHYFKSEGGVCRPAFDEETIAQQFARECNLLKRLGFAPTSYAGGWWYISHSVVSQLASFGFTFDSTINDVHLDSFGRVQPHAEREIGAPFWLETGLLEVPSVRALTSLGNLVARQRAETNFVVLALHDYDLLQSPINRFARRAVGALAKRDRILSEGEFVRQAVGWLNTNSKRTHR